MKKRLFALLCILMLLLPLLPAQADFGTLFMVVDCEAAPMYANFSGERALLRYVNRGEIVYFVAALDGSYCVAYENNLGYIDEQYLAGVDSRYYDFRLPNGGQYSAGGGNAYVEYRGTPYFTYDPVTSWLVQKLATRSGPGVQYTDTLTYPQSTAISAYCVVDSGDADWVCVEFTYRSEKYRLYTGVKRINAGAALPMAQEEYFDATIVQDVLPCYGPGYDYAPAKNPVPAGTSVQGVYQSVDGWLMFDYTLENGKIQRAWAPPQYWK